MDVERPNNAPAQEMLPNGWIAFLRFIVARQFIPLALSILPLYLINLVFLPINFLYVVPTAIVFTLLLLVLAWVYQWLINYGPTREQLLQLVGLIDYTYDYTLGYGPGSGTFKGTHRLDEGPRTITCMHHSSEDVCNYSMARSGLVAGFGQWAADTVVAQYRTWPEPYNPAWYPIVHAALGVPVGWLPTMLQKTAENLPDRYFWINVSRNHPTHVQYVVYLFEAANLLGELHRIRDRDVVPDAELLRIMKDFAGAVSRIHQERKYHGWLKPENVLVRWENHCRLILAPPASANYIPDHPVDEAVNAPDLYDLNTRVDTKTDVYYLGLLFRMMIEGRNNMIAQMNDLLAEITRPEAANRPLMTKVLQQLNGIQL